MYNFDVKEHQRKSKWDKLTLTEKCAKEKKKISSFGFEMALTLRTVLRFDENCSYSVTSQQKILSKTRA